MRRPKIALSTLLLSFVTLGLACGWYIDHRRQQKALDMASMMLLKGELRSYPWRGTIDQAFIEVQCDFQP